MVTALSCDCKLHRLNNEQILTLNGNEIAGLEDVLASRCIAIPMRRTDKKIPHFPPDFSGTSIRHQLYILALTYHREVYHHYDERPDLHKLQNRCGEL